VTSFNPTLKQQPRYGEPLKVFLQPEASAALENQAIARLQETTGFQPLADQFNPESYFQRYPKVQGEYDADYRDFSLNGKQTEAFKHIMAFTKARQIPVVFVNLPLTQIYLDETRTVSEKQFRRYLQQFARSNGLSVYDLSQRWLNRNAYFTDPSHLNRYGAAAVAVELGRLLALPESLLQSHRQSICSTCKL
jgi:penicillin V acylase-like amidase (Ntn superfamily)